MFYYLFQYLDQFDLPGAGLFQYISFRAAMTVIVSLLISLFIGKRIINYLRRKQIGETVRNLGLDGQNQKQGTPTMGGIIIIASIVVPVLLFGNLNNVYVILMLITTVWLGLIGFLDDYIKVFLKNKEGLRGKFKIIGQVGLGLIVGITFLLSDEAIIRERIPVTEASEQEYTDLPMVTNDDGESFFLRDHKTPLTTIPFVKNNEFNYKWLVWFAGKHADKLVWVVFILVVIFIVTAVSNGANLSDGLDGLATGSAAIIGTTLGIFAWVSGNAIFADYLNIMYIPNAGELMIYAAALIGATIGFLWYNSFPAQIFMGDTGSLALGGIIAVFAIVIRKELLIPILCGIYLFESVSVILQVSWFKHTKRKTGTGRRIFLMAPAHHHFQKLGYHEAKIVTRFWIIGLLLAVITVVTLKIR
ncbi:MAG: phospho-N-acetylmuramoyl-pentapeptide-transferase [Bacteroidales bacterium]|nr:phospho-N-acetylmuramoyl-pentapeptide-transferase [Bacteroidales bacterium]MDT8432506.1 phospho-N-acetylmuramoyl-pentapeptide-transferase [Bacteroidales bacterium]